MKLPVEILNWLEIKSSETEYAEISLKLIIHDGQLKRIERSCTEKLLPSKINGGNYDEQQ